MNLVSQGFHWCQYDIVGDGKYSCDHELPSCDDALSTLVWSLVNLAMIPPYVKHTTLTHVLLKDVQDSKTLKNILEVISLIYKT